MIAAVAEIYLQVPGINLDYIVWALPTHATFMNELYIE